MSQASDYKAELDTLWPVLAEMGANVFIILILAISLRILDGREEKVKGE